MGGLQWVHFVVSGCDCLQQSLKMVLLQILDIVHCWGVSGWPSWICMGSSSLLPQSFLFLNLGKFAEQHSG